MNLKQQLVTDWPKAEWLQFECQEGWNIMEERTLTFEEKLDGLLETAKKKKNVVEEQEILDVFSGEELTPEKLDRIYDFLENKNVDILRISADDDMDPDLFLEEDAEDEEIDMGNLDLSVPEGVGVEDPVRMY